MDELAEARTLLFSAVNTLFLEDPLLMKAVHFQLYPLPLVPLVVRRVRL